MASTCLGVVAEAAVHVRPNIGNAKMAHPWWSRSAHCAERLRHGALFVSLILKAANGKPCRCSSLAIAQA